MLMVMPRWRSSGALSIWSNADAWFRVGYLSARTFVIAAVRVVLPWSTWPMVPMLTCGLLRSNFAFATAGPPQDLMMRRATSCFVAVVRALGMDLDRTRCRARTRAGGTLAPPTTTVQGTDGHAFGPVRTTGLLSCSQSLAGTDAPLAFAVRDDERQELARLFDRRHGVVCRVQHRGVPNA